MVMRRGDDSDFKDKMSKKNKELTEYLDEIKVLNYFYFLLCLYGCALSLWLCWPYNYTGFFDQLIMVAELSTYVPNYNKN